MYSVQEAIEALRDFEDAYGGIYHVSDKFNLLLAYKGIRKGGELFVTYRLEYKGTLESENTLCIDIMKRIFQGLSIPYKMEYAVFDDDPPEVIQRCARFYYGSCYERFYELVHSSKQEDRREVAYLRAYPESAIQAFFSEQCFRADEFPDEIEHTPLRIFLCFMPSTSFWKDELQILRDQITLLSNDAPWLWKQGVKAYRAYRRFS